MKLLPVPLQYALILKFNLVSVNFNTGDILIFKLRLLEELYGASHGIPVTKHPYLARDRATCP